MTKEEMTICKIYLEDIDRTHDCNEYKLLMELLEQQPSDDCVSRANVKELFQEGCVMGMYDFLGIDDLPPVTPVHGTCKDCGRLAADKDGDKYCELSGRYNLLNFYCADFEKAR